MKVSEAMRRNIVIVEEDVSVAEASLSMRKKGEGCAIILSQGTPFGITSNVPIYCVRPELASVKDEIEYVVDINPCARIIHTVMVSSSQALVKRSCHQNS